MAYLVTLETPVALPRDIWERTPPQAQAYVGALEARGTALVAMVQALQEQLHQTSRHSVVYPQPAVNSTARNSGRIPLFHPLWEGVLPWPPLSFTTSWCWWPWCG